MIDVLERLHEYERYARQNSNALGVTAAQQRKLLNEAEDFAEAAAEIERLRHANRTRPDYNFRCGGCGAPHNLDTSIPSDIWNAIARSDDLPRPGNDALCTLCIDERMVFLGLEDEAEFYFSGKALRSKMYR